MMSAELLALRHAIAHAGERRLIWLEGEQDDCIVRAESLLWGAVFWLGQGPERHVPQPAAKALQQLREARERSGRRRRGRQQRTEGGEKWLNCDRDKKR